MGYAAGLLGYAESVPPLPKIHTSALVELAEELRFAPREALLRDIDRAEGLAGEIEPGLQYPADWVVFRVTGYRPEMDDPALIPGEALLGDLSSLVERLCKTARFTTADLTTAYETADELAARWGVSRKTISRWRRRGLIARRVHETNGTTRLIITAQASSLFADRHRRALAQAAGFSRIDPATENAIIRRAKRYHEVLGLPITPIAERLSTRYDRSTEAIRQVLLRHDAGAIERGKEPIFSEPRTLDARTQRVIERAWRRGVEPSALMKRYRRSRAGIHRIINEQRLHRLRNLDLGHIATRATELDAKGIERVLGAEPIAGGLSVAEVPEDMRELIALMRERVVPVGVEERAWARAEHALRARAAGLIDKSERSGFPEARLIDRAETDLRWAAQLRTALGQVQLHLVLETLETKLGVELSHMRGRDARVILEAGLRGLREGLDAFDPWTRGRLASPVGLAATRARVKMPEQRKREESDTRKRAQVRMLRGTAAPDWTACVSPWIVALRPDGRLVKVIGTPGGIEAELAAVLTERYGLGGVRPQTLTEVAAARGITVMQAGRLERQAIQAGLEAARKRAAP